MIKRHAWQTSESQVTPEDVYKQRRSFLKLGGAAAAGSILAPYGYAQSWRTDEDPAPFEAATTYNNFYEFGMDKTDPAKYAHEMSVDPWSVKIEGMVEKPGSYNLEDILKWGDQEERIYRLRCVEAWSMVIPWVGYPLASLLKQVKPLSKAKYVVFKTLADRKQMRGMRSRFSLIDWPYIEGLTIEEAANPLTLLTFGMYGQTLPNQNGAPVRLVIPWKYGFKSIKSIVSIEFTNRQPRTTWQQLQPKEYGFYANVNPEVSHPRWSQARERRLPGGIFGAERIDTQMFNGYGEQVAHLYKGLDLTKNY